MKHEYHEGPEAAANFVKFAKAIFQAPKPSKPVKKKAKSPRQKDKA